MGQSRETYCFILVLAIVVIIIVSTCIKVYDTHKRNLFRVVEQEITEAARKCILDGECEDEMTLKTLIEKKYIDKPVHPISKEFIKDDLVITCSNYECFTTVN